MTTQRVMVMHFVRGAKITDVSALDRMQAVRPSVRACVRPLPRAHARLQDPAALVMLVSAAFAQQIYLDGAFNADPHAGNIMIAKAASVGLDTQEPPGACRRVAALPHARTPARPHARYAALSPCRYAARYSAAPLSCPAASP